ncbi:unnamed protein product [Linum trigynum]|uniref:Uncharacterized protein n=1 Tax=Linum trigynum TaxID=586398 RepID=A0AAV2FC12_9ROSI
MRVATLVPDIQFSTASPASYHDCFPRPPLPSSSFSNFVTVSDLSSLTLRLSGVFISKSAFFVRPFKMALRPVVARQSAIHASV